MRLLAVREHGVRELERKLSQRHADCVAVIAQVLQQLQQDGWLNEGRYVASFVRKEIALGHGPLRLREALRTKGVAADQVGEAIQDAEVDWLALACQVREKKFGALMPEDRKSLAQQMRFLQYRGFDADTIRRVFKNRADE